MRTDKDEILKLFPAPGFRKYQKETLVRMAEEFETGVKCILLDAPTGFGKSPVNIAFAEAAEKAFYITPQLTLIDQMKRDKYVGKHITEIKGRQNYFCQFDPVATVDVGMCQRVKDFQDCKKYEDCPYYKQKMKALNAHTAIMSFAYFILEGYSESDNSFGRRELLILDESHNIDKFVVNYISLTISPWSVPFSIYQKVSNIVGNIKNIQDAISVISTVRDIAASQTEVIQTTLMGGMLSIVQTTALQKLINFVGNADRFLASVQETEWVHQINWSSYKGKNYPRLIVQPLYARTFMKDMIWCRAEKFIISSATLLNIPLFLREVGLDDLLKPDEVLHLKIPSTFPIENRPILDATEDGTIVMTRDEQEANFMAAVKVLEKIIELEPNINIAVHCHSYRISIGIMNLIDNKYKTRIVSHTAENRQEMLEEWMKSKGKVFLAVSFEEGQDWVGDICDCQVLFKVPYGDVGDKRVARRLELKEWKWYRNETLKTVIQSYGRAVRGPEEKAHYYVIDASFINLIKRTAKDIPEWYYDALPDHWKVLVDFNKYRENGGRY